MVGPFLGVDCWGAFARAAEDTSVSTCDLSGTITAYPAGVVGLLLLAHHRARLGQPLRVQPPTNPDLLNYLERIDLFSRLAECADIAGDVEHLRRNRRYESNRFTEIIDPANRGFSEVLSVIWEFFERTDPTRKERAFGIFDEVLANIRDHSSPEAPAAAACCVQIQVYRRSIELAFGDLGVGFRTSLSCNPHLRRYATDAQALKAAVLERHSRLSHEDQNRGGGLRRAFDLVHEVGGSGRILTRNGRVQQTGVIFRPIFGTTESTFPGTLAQFLLPRRAS